MKYSILILALTLLCFGCSVTRNKLTVDSLDAKVSLPHSHNYHSILEQKNYISMSANFGANSESEFIGTVPYQHDDQDTVVSGRDNNMTVEGSFLAASATLKAGVAEKGHLYGGFWNVGMSNEGWFWEWGVEGGLQWTYLGIHSFLGIGSSDYWMHYSGHEATYSDIFLYDNPDGAPVDSTSWGENDNVTFGIAVSIRPKPGILPWVIVLGIESTSYEGPKPLFYETTTGSVKSYYKLNDRITLGASLDDITVIMENDANKSAASLGVNITAVFNP